MPARRLILNHRRNYGNENRDKSWQGYIFQNRKVISAAFLLCCITLPLYLKIEKKDGFPISVDSQIACAVEGRAGSVKAMINAGVSFNSRNARSSTLLIEASWAGRLDIVKLLLDQKVDVNACTSSSITALLAAVLQRHDKIALMLLERGADPNAIDARGTTPLIEAAWRGNMNLVRELIAKGANANYMRPSDGLTALAIAKAANQGPVIQVLIAAGEKF
jgi:hypothetical protein